MRPKRIESQRSPGRCPSARRRPTPRPQNPERSRPRSHARQENEELVAMYPYTVPGFEGSGSPIREAKTMNDAPHTGPDRIPPGQYATDKWPVLSYGDTPRIAPERWTFRITGLVEAEKTLSWKDFQ